MNFPMPAVHFLTDSAHQRHLLAASNVLQAHLQAMVLLQYFMAALSIARDRDRERRPPLVCERCLIADQKRASGRQLCANG